MANNNEWSRWIIRALVLLTFSSVCTILTIQHNDLKAECVDRAEKDAGILEKHNQDIKEQNDKFNKAILEQNTMNGDIKKLLGEMFVKIEYIEKRIK